MRHFLIDGFNVFHQIPDIADSREPRKDFVHYIRRNNLTGSRNNVVTIVFDGYETAELSFDPIYRIVFSEERTADDVIKEQIRSSSDKRNLVVVSDDLDIRECARNEGVEVCRPRQFLAKRRMKLKNAIIDGYRGLSPSKMMDITEELAKVWKK